MRKIIETYGTAIAGGALFIVFALVAPNFTSPTNLMNVLKDASFLAILALGFTLALRVGELDLSIAEIASLAAVVAGWTIHHQYHPLLAIVASLAVSVALGVFNGFGVTRLRVPSLIVTLGVAAIAKGLSFMLTQGVAFVGRWPTGFTDIARGSLFGLSNLVMWMVAATGSAWFLLNRTRTGAHMIATGEADEAARLAGVETARIKRLGLTLSGLFAGIGAILLTANLSSAAPNMAADYFLYSIASVLLGMTMFRPGHPNIFGTIYAAIVLKILGNGLVLMGAPYYLQDMVLGFIIISSVAFSASVLKKAAFKV
jgi:ribose transport system permease protein